MIRTVYQCDLCQRRMDATDRSGLRLRFKTVASDFDLVPLGDGQASDRVVCMQCCRQIAQQLAKLEEVRS